MQPPIEIKSAFIQIDDEGILRARIKEGAKIDLKEVELSFEVYRNFGCHKNKVLKLVDGRSFFTMKDDAQKYSAKHGKDFFIAVALLNNSLAIRLLYSFFNMFLKQPVPFQMFSKEADALNWLRSFKVK